MRASRAGSESGQRDSRLDRREWIWVLWEGDWRERPLSVLALFSGVFLEGVDEVRSEVVAGHQLMLLLVELESWA